RVRLTRPLARSSRCGMATFAPRTVSATGSVKSTIRAPFCSHDDTRAPVPAAVAAPLVPDTAAPAGMKIVATLNTAPPAARAGSSPHVSYAMRPLPSSSHASPALPQDHSPPEYPMSEPMPTQEVFIVSQDQPSPSMPTSIPRPVTVPQRPSTTTPSHTNRLTPTAADFGQWSLHWTSLPQGVSASVGISEMP